MAGEQNRDPSDKNGDLRWALRTEKFGRQSSSMRPKEKKGGSKFNTMFFDTINFFLEIIINNIITLPLQ